MRSWSTQRHETYALNFIFDNEIDIRNFVGLLAGTNSISEPAPLDNSSKINLQVSRFPDEIGTKADSLFLYPVAVILYGKNYRIKLYALRSTQQLL